MQFALDDKNLGKWALLQQCRVPWLPYDRHKGLREARRLSYVHSWYISVTPPSHLLYVVFHLYQSVLYVGQTHLAPVQRLRKHLTDAAAGTDNSTLHRLMATTNSADWGIGVLQYVGDTWWTAVRERAWWWQLRRWVVNDIPPGIPDPTAGITSSARGWMNRKLLRVLRELRSAQDSHDYARAKFLQAKLQDMAQELQVPLNLTSAVIVPDVTIPQKTAICGVLRRVLRTTDMQAWQRQAYARLIRVVRSSPNKLHTVFDRAAKKADLGATRPECCCHKQRGRLDIGDVREAEGHLAVVPVVVKAQDGTVLRPRDGLPINGLKAREVTCKAIQAFAKQVKGAVPNLNTSLPAYLFPESGNGLKYVQSVVSDVACMLYVRIVDKGPGKLWGFCKAWAWDVVREFLNKEGYKPVQDTSAECHRLMSSIAANQGWSVNSKAELCRLYLLGKAKSLLKGKWLWRPIAANPKPVLYNSKQRLGRSQHFCAC